MMKKMSLLSALAFAATTMLMYGCSQPADVGGTEPGGDSPAPLEMPEETPAPAEPEEQQSSEQPEGSAGVTPAPKEGEMADDADKPEGSAPQSKEAEGSEGSEKKMEEEAKESTGSEEKEADKPAEGSPEE